MPYRYTTLPEACKCEKCGYVLENPQKHCQEIPCPKCGGRMWRVSGSSESPTQEKTCPKCGATLIHIFHRVYRCPECRWAGILRSSSPPSAHGEINQEKKRRKPSGDELKVTNVSITVICEDGRMTGTPWFDTAEAARAYAKKKCEEISCAPLVIKQYNWREGDTLETVGFQHIKEL